MKTTQRIRIEIPHPSRFFNRNIYEHIYDYDTFTEVHYGGASSGKSHGVIQKVIMKAADDRWDKPRKILCLRKVGSSVKDSIFEEVKSGLSDFGLLSRCKVNNSDFRIKLPNGAVFLFKGLDDPEKIKSIKGVSDIVMEEASEFTLNDYTQLTLRLRDIGHKDRQIYLMFNPVSKVNWVYKYFFEHGTPPDTKIFQSTYRDNKFLDQQTIRTIENLARTNPAYHKIYALGEFATLDKLVFPKYTRKVINRKEVAHLPSYFGLDFGYVNDPSALMHVKIDHKNRLLYVMDEFVKKGLLNNELAQVIIDLGFGKERIFADSAEQKSIQEIRLSGVPRITAVKKWPDSIIQGIQFLLQYEWIVNEGCVKTIEELENYTWQKDRKTNEYINKPNDSFNHCMDAIRYALSVFIYEMNRKKPLEKARAIQFLRG